MRALLLIIPLLLFAGAAYIPSTLHFEDRPTVAQQASLSALPPAAEISAAPSSSATTTLMFVGDIQFDRAIRVFADAYGPDYIFSCLAADLTKPAAVIANVEGPITANASVSAHVLPDEPGNTQFTFPLYLPDLLKRYNIKIANLGNNHIHDFGAAGIASTTQALDAAGVEHFGDPDEKGVPRSLLAYVDGKYIAFVNYNEWFGTKDDAIDAIKKYAGLVPVVVYTHWGDEYEPPPDRVKTLAHEFVDAGASIVIGSHPHVVQTHEVYKGVPIYYSLGNFIFDQYWDPSVMTGLALEVDFKDNKIVGVREDEVDIGKNGQSCFAKQ